MKNLFTLLCLLGSFAALADQDCAEILKKEVLDNVAEELNTSAAKLKIRLIGTEDTDGDYESGSEGRYNTGLQAYYDVFLKGENPNQAKALTLIYVNGTSTINDLDPSENECSIYEIEAIDSEEWDNIYDTYL